MRLRRSYLPEEVPHDRLEDVPSDKDVDVLVTDVSESAKGHISTDSYWNSRSTHIGPAKVLMKPIALTMIPDAARPLARIVVSRASAGITPCRGV